jgi:parallel beta-helix repeat protein
MGSFTAKQIHDMEAVGIQLEGDASSICGNDIFNCQTHGVHLAADAEPAVIDNTFHGNGDLTGRRCL